MARLRIIGKPESARFYLALPYHAQRDVEESRCGVGLQGRLTGIYLIRPAGCQGKIIRVVGAAVLFGDDVFNVVNQFAEPLGQTAVLAAKSGPTLDAFAGYYVCRHLAKRRSVAVAGVPLF